MSVDQIERLVCKRQALGIGHFEPAREPLLRKVCSGERDRRLGEIDTGHLGAAPGKPREIHAGAAADLEHRAAAPAAKIDEPKQVVKLLEMILIEVVEEAARSDRMPGDLEVVDVPFPVFAHLFDSSHRLKL